MGIPLIGIFKKIKEPTVSRRFFFISPAPAAKSNPDCQDAAR